MLPPQPPLTTSAAPNLTGLTEAEVQKRRAAGQSNRMPLKTSRSYGQIVRENVFNFINNVLFTLGALLVILGRYLDALISVGVVVLNTIVSLLQEVRAKILLDRIAILTRPKATVVRDGKEREVDPGEIVLGDLLVIHSGDQVVVDGRMVAGEHMEVDESLLTGESDLIPKHVGDELFSGSFCVTGGGHYAAEKVGADCLVNKITAGAQAFRRVLTPLQRRVNFIIRSVLLAVLAFEVLVAIKSLVENLAFVETVRMSTVIVALVPNGLVLAIALAYALGAIRMAGKGALVQQANAVESLSNVDVLCTDKTGTLTTNTIKLNEVEPFARERAELGRLLGDYAASTSEGNRTTEALQQAYRGQRRRVADEAVFSSARKWSALAIDDDGMRGTYVLGAPEMLQEALEPGTDLGERLDEWTSAGLRVLLFAHVPEVVTLRRPGPDGTPGDGRPELPPNLMPLGLISLSDELRPKVRDTLREFSEAGIALKIISGDNPQTVAALARQAGLSDVAVVSGLELETLDDADLEAVAEESTIFGRVTPDQKERLVGALRARGHYVAMIGDGVNDVISLKRANVGIAMQGGSQAARAVADLILLKDSFAALPWAFREGQRIFNGMQDILKIFMVRILSKALLIGGVMAIGGFPFQPRQASILSFFAAGVPAIALAAWAKPGPSSRGDFMSRLGRFVVPASLLMTLIAVGLYAIYATTSSTPFITTHPGGTAQAVGQAMYTAQTVVTAFLVYCALLLIPLTVPPTPFWSGGSELRRDWKPTALSVLLFLGFMVVALTKLGRTSFDLALLSWRDFLVCGAAAVMWAFGIRWLWRTHVLDRFLGTGGDGPSGAPPPGAKRDTAPPAAGKQEEEARAA